MPIIEVDNLSKQFGEIKAVDGVSFKVEEGEVFGFLGPNGAGKTTTINMLCTLLRPTSGQARVAGLDVIKDKNDVRRAIGLVFQETTLDDYLTAEQNILFHALAYAVPSEVRKQRTKELLTLMELWERRKSKIRTYSGGMKRRLEIARGLVHLPRVLFLDEPTLGLDPQTRNRIWEYILDLREKQGLTIFLTTHYMDEAEHSDRIAVIDHGKIVALNTPDSLKDQVGGDVLTISSDNNELVEDELRDKYGLVPEVNNGTVSVRVPGGEEFLPQFVRAYEGTLQSIGLRRPTLEDVFLHLTGREIRDEKVDERALMRNAMRARYR
ncbi:MAG: ATP-binding cassette domain-containing protein [SAR202 cluster bacterium]|nr:ATP-binding cassette domain-containing protein [SAR202 cluster bacterium]